MANHLLTVVTTTDLEGYQKFWNIWLTRLCFVVVIVILELAALIWIELWKR